MKIPAGQFKSQCLQLVDQVKETHEEIIITKYGRPVGKLVSVNDQRSSTLRPQVKKV